MWVVNEMVAGKDTSETLARDSVSIAMASDRSIAVYVDKRS